MNERQIAFFQQCAATSYHLQKIVGLQQLVQELYTHHANQAAHTFDPKRKEFHSRVALKLGEFLGIENAPNPTLTKKD